MAVVTLQGGTSGGASGGSVHNIGVARGQVAIMLLNSFVQRTIAAS